MNFFIFFPIIFLEKVWLSLDDVIDSTIESHGGGNFYFFLDIENDMIPYFMMKNKSPLLLDLLLSLLLLLLLLLLPICILQGIKRAAAAGPSRPLTLPSTGRVFTKGPRDFQIDLPDRSPPAIPCPCPVSVWSYWPASSFKYFPGGLSV